jgi:hypothetical protein
MWEAFEYTANEDKLMYEHQAKYLKRASEFNKQAAKSSKLHHEDGNDMRQVANDAAADLERRKKYRRKQQRKNESRPSGS